MDSCIVPARPPHSAAANSEEAMGLLFLWRQKANCVHLEQFEKCQYLCGCESNSGKHSGYSVPSGKKKNPVRLQSNEESDKAKKTKKPHWSDYWLTITLLSGECNLLYEELKNSSQQAYLRLWSRWSHHTYRNQNNYLLFYFCIPSELVHSENLKRHFSSTQTEVRKLQLTAQQ